MVKPTDTFSYEPATTPLQESWNYEVAVENVETIIARIEAGELELEEVFEQFAAAVEYLRQCETFLQQRQQQVDLVIKTLNEPQF